MRVDVPDDADDEEAAAIAAAVRAHLAATAGGEDGTAASDRSVDRWVLTARSETVKNRSLGRRTAVVVNSWATVHRTAWTS